MEQNRREFLTGAAWMGVAAMAAGCISKGSALNSGAGAPMHGFRVPPMKRVRVGFIGVGGRGTPAVHRIAQIPGCEVAAKPFTVDEIDMTKFDFGKGVTEDKAALNT